MIFGYFSEDELLHFARGGFWQLTEDDILWRFELCHVFAAEGDNLIFGHTFAFFEYDEGAWRLAPMFIWFTDDCSFQNCRVFK